MPELPEVETVCRGLQQSVLQRRIIYVKLFRPNLRLPFGDDFCKTLMNSNILFIKRRAKYLQLFLDNDQILIIHLGMSGKLIVHNQAKIDFTKHDHVAIWLNDDKQIIYNDPRRFGLMVTCHISQLEEHPLFSNLGPEPLTDAFNAEYLTMTLANKKIPIKLALMDNNIVVGVGNIYACESLYRSGISPLRPSNQLSEQEIARLIPEIRNVLNKAIAAGGSTLRDYVDASGASGYFQHNFQVYGQNDKPCSICDGLILRIKQGGRSSFYCDSCQK